MAAALLLTAGVAGRVGAAEPDPGAAEHEALESWRFGRPAELPAAGFSWRHDVAAWELESGRIRLQEPTTDGAITGLVFEGRGRFRMEVPDRFELRQLRRFAGEPELTAIDVEFDTLVLRTSDSELLGALATSARGPYRPHSLARKRHERWLRRRQGEIDARIVGARRSAGDSVLRVEIDTRRFGRLTYDYDARRHEEIQLWRYHAAYSFLESWLSLDRAEDRAPSGRPGPRRQPPFDLLHAELEARLLEVGRDPGASRTQRVTFRGDFRAALELGTLRAGQEAVLLTLHPMAEISAVFDGEGRPLSFLRDPTGRRFRSVDNRLHSPSVMVLLPTAPAPGEKLRLIFEYRLEVRNYLPGGWWYPSIGPPSQVLLDPHTVGLEVAVRERYEVRSMGEAGAERLSEGVRTGRWRVERPVRMSTFSFARNMVEQRVARPGVPEVVAFSPPLGSDTAARLRQIGVDVADALAFYSELLDAPLERPHLHVTLIQALHGQAFQGLLQLAEESAFRQRTGPSERFHAHEVAHLWWGHRVGWASYRDQWLSEGMSNYLALLFLEGRHEKGRELYDEAIEVYTRQVLGSLGSSMSPFARPGLALMNMRSADRIGPIGHGVRAAVGEARQAYRSQSYEKSVLVLHSLRSLLRAQTGSDDAFVAVLRDLIRTHDGGELSTDDFAAAVGRHVAGDWGRFVDQWIRSAAIPEWRWRVERLDPAAAAADGARRVSVVVDQSGVDSDFRTPVPVRITYADGTREVRLIEVAGPSTDVELELSSPAREVELNPDHAVLARMNSR